MALEDSVNTLVNNTTALLNAVNVSKATLDGSVADAQAADASASSSASAANNSKLAAEAAATSATNTAAALAGFDLEAIAQSKAVTAVDVFVYDTSKDSDGGAWRKRTQHTSWYNETLNTATRGARKEFPAVAVIVAEADKVTIYDGDDPAMPMWMVFNVGTTEFMIHKPTGASLSSVAAMNGILATTSNSGSSNLTHYGVPLVNFISDSAFKYSDITSKRGDYRGDISLRNTSKGYADNTSLVLASRVTNDVAMTVLPSAPIDSATGLPVPTIAVATDGGVSVIKDDGTVVDSVQTSLCTTVAFNNENDLFYQNIGYIRFARAGNYSADGFGSASADSYSYGGAGNALQLDVVSSSANIAAYNGKLYDGDNRLLQIVEENTTTPSEGMVSYITSSYNTGWMPGDIKLATLSDTTAETVVGSELVTNGTFDVDTSGWTNYSGSVSHDTGGDGGRVLVTSSGSYAGGYQAIATEIGKTYVVNYLAEVATSTPRLRIGDGVNNVRYVNYVNAGQLSVQFVAESTTTFLTLCTAGATGTAYFDNISVRLAEPDRSVNNNGLIVNGSITKAPVATGADLVAYSGFSSTNYLEQPYNPDLDFGTGDFYVMGWVKITTSVSQTLIYRAEAGRANSGFGLIYNNGTTTFDVYISDDGFTTSDVATVPATSGVWAFLVAVRSGSSLLMYKNGEIGSTTSIVNTVGSLSNTNATLQVGYRQDNVIPLAKGSLALWRIGAGAPTAEQIARIYEDEKVLFQEGAQATLYGTSDAVTALAYDEVTDLLHVGTSAGRSVFQGLRRVENTTDAVGTAISAHNNLVVEE